MFKEIMTHNSIVDYPLMAMILFMTMFAFVVLRVMTSSKYRAHHERLAQLPLEDDPNEVASEAAEEDDHV